jgi:hypothetical protein
VEKPDIPKTLGQAIDAIVEALKSLDQASRATAIRAACDHLNIRPPENVGARQTSYAGAPGVPVAGVVPAGPTDIRTLRQEKRPSSANEMAALVAFYLSEIASERKTEVTLDDMIKYFKQAGFSLPKVPKVLLANAKNAGYFDTVGEGKYRLNPVGYNLVAHNLPRTGSGETTPLRKKRQRGQRKTKN